MQIDKHLSERANNLCELCGNNQGLATYKVEPKDEYIVVCSNCKTQLEDTTTLDENHWHCLNDSMWSDVEAVKVVAYRLFSKLQKQDMLDMIYLEEETLSWAKDLKDDNTDTTKLIYKDANGTTLDTGDSVSIIKDLPVKGAGFTAKQGTTVKNISLVADDETHIEGRVNGVKIHLKTCFLKKL